METETDTTTRDDTATEDTSDDTQATSEPTFTQTQLNSHVARIRRDLEAKFERKLASAIASQSKPEETPKANADDADSALAEIRAELNAERQARRFAEAIAGHKLSRGQKATLKKLFLSESPDDPDEWFAETIDSLGISQSTPEPTPTPAPAKSIADDQPRSNGAIDRGTLHPSQITADMVARMGPQKVRDYVAGYYRKKR